MFRFFSIATAVLVLAACQSQPISGYSIPRDSTFVLNEDVTVPVGWSRVFVQYGKVTEPNRINEFDHYCQIVQIELSRPGQDPQVIRADEFRTGKVFRRSAGASANRLVAGTSFSPGNGDDRSNQTWVTEVFLHSPRQPQVRKLVCGYWGDPLPPRQYMNVSEMQAVLGDLASLSVPER